MRSICSPPMAPASALTNSCFSRARRHSARCACRSATCSCSTRRACSCGASTSRPRCVRLGARTRGRSCTMRRQQAVPRGRTAARRRASPPQAWWRRWRSGCVREPSGASGASRGTARPRRDGCTAFRSATFGSSLPRWCAALWARSGGRTAPTGAPWRPWARAPASGLASWRSMSSCCMSTRVAAGTPRSTRRACCGGTCQIVRRHAEP